MTGSSASGGSDGRDDGWRMGTCDLVNSVWNRTVSVSAPPRPDGRDPACGAAPRRVRGGGAKDVLKKSPGPAGVERSFVSGDAARSRWLRSELITDTGRWLWADSYTYSTQKQKYSFAVNVTTRIQFTMRLPYVPDPPPTSTPEEADILARVQARRGERGLLPLDRALLHSFPVANGWNTFFGAVRTQTSLPADIRELAICRVAALNGAWFEWEHHAPLLREAGMSEDGMRVVRDPESTASEEEGVLSRAQRAVLRYTDAMTKTVRVPDEIFQELRACFSDREVVEVTATVAAYNCCSRFLVALDVGEKNR
ncbi:hypothetical protein VTN02DRAFT_4750 [Thermoascus thermophilus]